MEKNQEAIPREIASQIQQSQQTALLDDAVSQSCQGEHNRPPPCGNGVNNHRGNGGRKAGNGGHGGGGGPLPRDSSIEDSNKTPPSHH
ncbi:hypothetical protein P8452_02227 [Trifolium repens]|nr:hypothetical protein P8452_02227 [Trifolium repens]